MQIGFYYLALNVRPGKLNEKAFEVAEKTGDSADVSALQNHFA
jgi:hypothetical protein